MSNSYRAPAASDPDFHVLALLNAAFTGGSSLGLFGTTTTNKSSRLYRALVDSGLAAGVFGSLAPTIDPYLYSIGAVVRAGQSVTDVMTAMDAEVARLGSAPITQSELDKAMKRARVELISASQSVSGQGQMLGYSEIVARDHEWFDKALARMDAISLADLERVRAAYLRPSVRTVGIYEPTTNGSKGQ